LGGFKHTLTRSAGSDVYNIDAALILCQRYLFRSVRLAETRFVLADIFNGNLCIRIDRANPGGVTGFKFV